MSVGDFVILAVLAIWLVLSVCFLGRMKKQGRSIGCIGCGGCRDGMCTKGRKSKTQE